MRYSKILSLIDEKTCVFRPRKVEFSKTLWTQIHGQWTFNILMQSKFDAFKALQSSIQFSSRFLRNGTLNHGPYFHDASKKVLAICYHVFAFFSVTQPTLDFLYIIIFRYHNRYYKMLI